MSDIDLEGINVLIAEDEYMIAVDLVDELSRAGARILGPAGTLAKTLRMIEEAPSIDVAALDVNLRGEMVYPAADELRQRRIPFVFTTGYDISTIPARFRDVAICEKPIGVNRIARKLHNVLMKA